MKSLIASFCIYIIISIPVANLGSGLVHSLISDAEYELARLELYSQYYGADSLTVQNILPVIAYTYQLQGNHLKAKLLYKRAIQNSSLLSDGYVDSIKTNLCFSLLELYEYGTAYGLFGSIESDVIIPIKKGFYILTVERNSPSRAEIFTPDEIASVNEFAQTLKSPKISRLLSAIIPGAGQFYSSHHIDGAQSLVVVGAGTLYSAISYKAYQSGETGIFLPTFTIGVTALFHYANILSGYRTAIYRNMKLKQDYLAGSIFEFHPVDLSLHLP